MTLTHPSRFLSQYFFSAFFLRATEDSYVAQLNTAPFQSPALSKLGSSSFRVSLTRPIIQPDRNTANAEDIQLTPPKIRVIHHAIHRTVVTIEQNFNPD